MSDSKDTHEYEVVVVGGGPAGMTAALYSTRLGHTTAVVTRGGGRAATTAGQAEVGGVRVEGGCGGLHSGGCELRVCLDHGGRGAQLLYLLPGPGVAVCRP